MPAAERQAGGQARQRRALATLAFATLLASACSAIHEPPDAPGAGTGANEDDGQGGVSATGGGGDSEGGGGSSSAGSSGATSSAGNASTAGAGSSAQAGSAADAGPIPDGPHSLRCALAPVDSRPCEDGGIQLGYYAAAFSPAPPFRCTPNEQGYCTSTPPPFATLAECLAECEPDAHPDATSCQDPGEREPACDPSLAADSARLEAETPLGPLLLTRAWLERESGFTNSVRILFTARLEARFDAKPSVRVWLPDPIQDPQHLVGEHDRYATITLCDRTLDIPVRVTVSTDELRSGVSERFDATIESLVDDIELQAQVSFSHVCLFSTSI